jgi:transcription initiation factor IIF auxiliary subunit
MTIRFNNYSISVEKRSGEDWSEWCVFVDEKAETLDKINFVEYTLHRTFPNPIRVIKDREDRFALFTAGWGEFMINVRVVFGDGSSEYTTHHIRLEKDNWPKKPVPKSFPDEATRKVYQKLIHEKYRWRKTDTIITDTGLPEDVVISILNRLRQDNYVRKAPYLSIDNKELWGATAIVGISPRL